MAIGFPHMAMALHGAEEYQKVPVAMACQQVQDQDQDMCEGDLPHEADNTEAASDSSDGPCGIWEYQRYWPGIGWLRRALAASHDPPPFADDDGKQIDPPPESWFIIIGGGTDAEGWEYASAATKFGTFRDHGRGVMGPNDRLRRRRWEAARGVACADMKAVIESRKSRKDLAMHGVRRQMLTLVKSRSVMQNLDSLNPVLWRILRKQHRTEYQAFLDKLPLAEFGPNLEDQTTVKLLGNLPLARQYGPADRPAYLPSVADIRYAFRFMVAAYGSIYSVDAASQRRKMWQLSGLPGEESFLKVKEEGETLQPAYGLFLDHARHRCVLAIRGTATVEDALTNTVAEPVFDESLGEFVHKGIRDAATWILDEVTPAMKSASATYSHYTLMVTGHSLGAGVAAMVTLMLDCQEPYSAGFTAVHGIGFATPCIAPLEVAEGGRAMRCFTTIACGRDAIFRTCVPNIYMMHHELSMASLRTHLTDAAGRMFGGAWQRRSERRHSSGAMAAEKGGGPKCFPVGACIVFADVGEESARALVAMPSDITKMFVHEDMWKDHAVDRYEIGLRCLGSPAAAETLFFGFMAHEDWGEITGQLFATEIEAREKYCTSPWFTASMVVNPLGEVLAYHGVDKAKGRSRKSEMMDWYMSACKNEVYENNGPYACMRHLKPGQVEGWFFNSMTSAREKYRSLGFAYACMIVDKNGDEVLFYGVDQVSLRRNSNGDAYAASVRKDMLSWFEKHHLNHDSTLLEASS